jgi:hypothetical protein
MDIELKQASSAAMMEYNKKGKCAELERFEREKVMQIFDITTEEPASGVLMQLDASLVIKRRDFRKRVGGPVPPENVACRKRVCHGERDQGRCLYLHCILRQKEEAGTILNLGFRFSG